MRTTITISEDLYREAKATAAASARTVSQVIEDAVRAALRTADTPETAATPLPVFGGSGVLPGIDLSDPRSLHDAMDDDRDLDALR